MPLISVGRGKQTCEFQDSQGYTEIFYLKKGGGGWMGENHNPLTGDFASYLVIYYRRN